MASILRVPNDVGLLTNRRMALEVAVGMAALSGRRLSMPWHEPLGSSPAPRFEGLPRPTMTDLWDVPVPLVTEDEWDEVAPSAHGVGWPDLTRCVYLADDVAIPHPALRAFANGRTLFVRLPDTDDHSVVELEARPLAWWSYFFHATGETRRRLRRALDAVRTKEPYVALAAQIASGLGTYNVAHVRRTDMVVGIRPYAGVSPQYIARSLAGLLPTDELLVVASEADPASSLFDPLRAAFREVVFLNDLIVRDHAAGFAALPFQEDNALGLVTQEIAARAERFVGTMGSTFTGLIQRLRLQRDPAELFRYTADYTPAGPEFRKGTYRDRHEGRYSWNRIGYAMSPDTLSWIREWPEAVHSPDDEVPDRAEDPRLVAAPIHAVVCTDTNPYGDWQSRFLEHTWRDVRQPGELVRLVATPDARTSLEHDTARIVTTLGRNLHPRTGDAEYAGYNRLWSLAEWLAREQPRGAVLVLDCDFAFRAPIDVVPHPGEIVGQRWLDFGLSDELHHALAGEVDADLDALPPVTWPFVVGTSELAALMPRWLELTALLRDRLRMWESDMFALCAALAESPLTVRYATLGAWMNWPEDEVAGAPIVHYCQPVEARDGTRLWWKQGYRPWEPLGFDPEEARLDYVRDLMARFDAFVRTRPPLQAEG